MNNRLLVPRKVPGLLDLVPGAAAAYSLRSLSNSYAGPVVTVRRSSDDAEEDFTAAEVSDGTLAAFCGAGDGFVKQWWDQSGNAVHAAAPVVSNEPLIVSAGAVILEEGKPAIKFDGLNDGLVSPYSIDLASSKKMTVVSAMTYSTGTTNCISLGRDLYSDYQRGASIAIFPSSNYSEIVVGNGATFYAQYRIAVPTTGQHLWATVISAPSASVKSGFDGAVSAVPYAAGSGGKTVANWLESGSGSHALAIGARLLPAPSLNQFSNMRYQELVLYTDDMSEQLQLIEGQIAWSYSQ
jgi:hypothetical protein